jgi:Putative zinc-finger
MKCDACLELLEEYLDCELAEREASEVSAHLITCRSCSAESTTLAVEQEMFSRYDRELELPPSLWRQVAERTVAPVVTPVSGNGFVGRLSNLLRAPAFNLSVATVVALVIIAILIGSVYRGVRQPEPTPVRAGSSSPSRIEAPQMNEQQRTVEQASDEKVAVGRKPKSRRPAEIKRTPMDQSDVLSSDFGYQDIDDQDTAKHIEQTQNLLRSIRNVQLNDSDQDIDVSYDKALSRRLLNENIVLRRDAEMKAKFPTKALLSDLEPFLIDIANLPDQAKPDDLRVIKERVNKTEIVAALIGYE